MMSDDDKPVPRFECKTCGKYWPNEEEKKPEVMKDYVPRANFKGREALTFAALPEGKRVPKSRKKTPLELYYFHVHCMKPDDMEAGRMENISRYSSPEQKKHQIDKYKKLRELAASKGIEMK